MDDIQVGDQFLYANRLFTVKVLLGVGSVMITEVDKKGVVNTHQVSKGFLKNNTSRVDTGCLPYSHRY